MLQVCIATALLGARERPQRIRAGILVGLLLIGTAASLSDVGRGIERGLVFSPPPLSTVRSTNEIPGPAGQLFSDGSSFFWIQLARTPTFD